MGTKKSYDLKVSVIMPSLNVKSYIGNAVKSVQNQTLQEIEIICVDAGSTDGTYEVLEELAAYDSRIIILKSCKKSYGYQVNYALSIARGEYVGIVETDDFVADNMFELLYREGVSKDLDYVKCDYNTYVTAEGENKILSFRKISDDSYYYSSVFCPKKHPDTVFDDWYLWNGIYRRTFLNENDIRFNETKGAAFQDIGFLHKTCVAARNVLYLNQPLYRYCVDREGASSNTRKSIFFIRQEYGYLINLLGVSTKKEEWNLLYRRMAKSFARAFMDCDDSFLSENEARDIWMWFQPMLKKAENMGFIDGKMLPIGLQNAYRHLMNSLSGYIVYRKMREYEICAFVRNDPVIIFGCGKYGKEAFQYINQRGGNVIRFMDNNPRLWNTTIEGVLVDSPDMIEGLPGDIKFIIANEKHAQDIYEQLIKKIEEQRVIIF